VSDASARILAREEVGVGVVECELNGATSLSEDADDAALDLRRKLVDSCRGREQFRRSEPVVKVSDVDVFFSADRQCAGSRWTSSTTAINCQTGPVISTTTSEKSSDVSVTMTLSSI